MITIQSIKSVLKYVGNAKCICALVLGNDDKYYIFTARTGEPRVNCEQNSYDVYGWHDKEILRFTKETSYEFSMPLVADDNDTILKLIQIKNPEFFDDAVKIIQSFIR